MNKYIGMCPVSETGMAIKNGDLQVEKVKNPDTGPKWGEGGHFREFQQAIHFIGMHAVSVHVQNSCTAMGPFTYWNGWLSQNPGDHPPCFGPVSWNTGYTSSFLGLHSHII